MSSRKKKLSSYLFVEKFRPDCVADMVLPKNIKNAFLQFIQDGQIPNIILQSATPGSGKTTLAKAICLDLGLEDDSIYINASSENGIDTLRNRITKFASTKSMTGRPKVIILDEFDGAGKSLQQGLRAAIEEFSHTCRFIFTCNYISQIIDPLKSRCQVFDMNHTEATSKSELIPQVVKRLRTIVKAEDIEVTDPDIINRIVEKFFPDIRKCVQIIQQYSQVTKCLDEGIFRFESIDAEFFDLINKGKLKSIREYVKQKNYNFDELYSKLFNEFVPVIEDKSKVPNIIITLNQYQISNASVVDKELNFTACILEVIGILNG